MTKNHFVTENIKDLDFAKLGKIKATEVPMGRYGEALGAATFDKVTTEEEATLREGAKLATPHQRKSGDELLADARRAGRIKDGKLVDISEADGPDWTICPPGKDGRCKHGLMRHRLPASA